MPSDGPFTGPVVDLVDIAHMFETQDDRAEMVAAAAARVLQWADTHPGRWCMFFAEGQGVCRDSMAKHARRAGTYTITEIKEFKGPERKVFLRLDHPEGEPLKQALQRPGSPRFPVRDLPELERSEFNWTAEELADATALARQWLWPVRALSGNGERPRGKVPQGSR